MLDVYGSPIQNWVKVTQVVSETPMYAGQIETVKLGSSKADIKAAGDMDVFQQDVTDFLTSEAAKGYTTIESALNSGDSDVISGLIACFNPQA